MNNNTSIIPDEAITAKIYLIGGKRVMLDRDLAELYGVKPIRLREQVKRNQDRFPEHFMFRLSEKEVDQMVSHFAIPSKQHLGGTLPFVFTEYGVLMLANVLKSEQAVRMSIRIIEIFVKLRDILLTHKEIWLKLEQLELNLLKQDHRQHKVEEEIQLIFQYLKQLLNPPSEERKEIGFKRKE